MKAVESPPHPPKNIDSDDEVHNEPPRVDLHALPPSVYSLEETLQMYSLSSAFLSLSWTTKFFQTRNPSILEGKSLLLIEQTRSIKN